MKLDFIAFEALSVSKLNMRHGTKPPDISDVLPSVRARGILVPLLVRPRQEDAPGDGGGDGVLQPAFEIVAGRRRYYSAAAPNEGAK
jgi:ParB family chromosome partitioning protein